MATLKHLNTHAQSGKVIEVAVAPSYTVLKTSDNKLRIVGWNISNSQAGGTIQSVFDQTFFPVKHVCAAVNFLFTPTNTRLLVTACIADGDTLKLSTWLAGSSSIAHLKDAAAGQVSEIALCTLWGDLVLTAVRAHDGTLKLIIWSVMGDGSIARKGEQVLPEPVSYVGAAMCTGAVSQNFTTTFRRADHTLGIVEWHASSDGMTITKAISAHTTYKASEVAAPLDLGRRSMPGYVDDHGVVVTAAVTENMVKQNGLYLDLWDTRATITSAATIMGAKLSNVAVIGVDTPFESGRLVTVGRDGSGKFALGLWSDIGESLKNLATATGDPCDKVAIWPHGDLACVAAIDSGGQLKISTWQNVA